MRRVNFIWIVILLMLTGCGGNKRYGKENDGIITVDVTARYPEKELILQDFMDIEYVALETNDDFLNQGVVRGVGKEIIPVRNRIEDGDIFLYDRNGKALRKINRKGQGGEEYLYISEVIIEEDNNEMFINDVGKTVVYDLYGNFKRSIRYIGDNMTYMIYNLDKENLIHVSKDSEGRQQHTVISKQDGSIEKTIEIPYEEVKSPILSRTLDGGMIAASVYNYRSIIPNQNSLVLTESSSDTIYRFLDDYTIHPFMIRTPSIQSMEPEVFLFPRMFTERYYFMESWRKEWGNNLRTNLMYDRQEKSIYTTTIINDDFFTKRQVDIQFATVNNEIAFWQTLEAYELVEAYQNGELKDGKLKEIASKLNEDDNPIIMLVKYKK